jgi:hypothetical protein
MAMLWIPPLGSSLWLDETSTYWVVRDGFLKTLERGHRYSPSGTLYLVLVYLVKQIAGSSELALRLPSFAGLVIAVVMIARLGAELVDGETGLLAALVFATDGSVVIAAADARPYGLALLTVIAAIHFLVRWTRTERWSHAVTYAAFASASAYLHRLFASMFLVHAFYLWQLHRRGGRPPALAVVRLGGLVALFLLPLAADTWGFALRASQFSWSGAPGVDELSVVIVPPAIVLGLVSGTMLSVAAISGVHVATRRLRAAPMAFLIVWALTPPTLLYVMALVSPARSFLARYALGAIPGLALSVATLVRSLEPSRARRMVALAILCVSLLKNFGLSRHFEEWRNAAREASKCTGCPVLVRSGAIESRDVNWLTDPDTRDYMIAPFTYYRVAADVTPLPFEIESKPAVQYMESVLDEKLRDADRFVLVSRQFGDDGRTAAWLRGRLGPRGFCARSLGNFGFVEATQFERRLPSCDGEGCRGDVRCF